jgi:hypothetical protein
VPASALLYTSVPSGLNEVIVVTAGPENPEKPCPLGSGLMNASEQRQHDEHMVKFGFHNKFELCCHCFDEELIYASKSCPRPPRE